MLALLCLWSARANHAVLLSSSLAIPTLCLLAWCPCAFAPQVEVIVGRTSSSPSAARSSTISSQLASESFVGQVTSASGTTVTSMSAVQVTSTTIGAPPPSPPPPSPSPARPGSPISPPAPPLWAYQVRNGVFAGVSVGLNHTCALRRTDGADDGFADCFGQNDYGQLNVPLAAAQRGPYKMIACGDLHTCAIRDDDKVVCWGSNSDGQSSVPPGLGQTLLVSAGSRHT